MMFASLRIFYLGIGGVCAVAGAALAGQPKLDKETCVQLHTEQATFIQSGILADLSRGPAWGKSNLSADRLREIEHYIMLDEQIKFACREATLTPEMMRVEEIAKRLELNPNLDPFAPPPPPDAAGAGAAASPDAPSGLSPAPDEKPKVRKPKPAAAKPASAANDALKAPPVYVAPAPAGNPAASAAP
ncbi:MAG: hypothetical protein ABL897_03985 [Hyphomicrobium sp.]